MSTVIPLPPPHVPSKPCYGVIFISFRYSVYLSANTHVILTKMFSRVFFQSFYATPGKVFLLGNGHSAISLSGHRSWALVRLTFITDYKSECRHAVAQLVEALRYGPEGRGFDSRWCHWNFFNDVILLAALWPRG